jgi:FkbM family methyltransferase
MLAATDIAKLLKRLPPAFDVAARVRRMVLRDPIHRRVRQFSLLHSEVRFLQIGSNDGMSGDPIREFVVQNKTWRGAFVEPVPQIFSKLRRNYAYLKRPGLKFLNYAVSDRSGVQDFWKIRDDCLSEFALFANLIGSFDRNHIVKHFPGIAASKLERIHVPCKRYEDVLADAGLDDVDLLNIDVEGHESRILRSIPFGRSNPQLIVFETSHMAHQLRDDIVLMLRRHGYSVEQYPIDCIASM